MKGMLILFLAALIGLPIMLGFYLSAPKYSGPVSKYFDGKIFHNEVSRDMGFFDLVSWLMKRKPGAWSNHKENKTYALPRKQVTDGITITFINHATLLIQADGINILSDPIWSERCSPVSFMGPKRVRPPGLTLENLPPIDAVLISHNHYDHLDIPTLKYLAQKTQARFFSGLGNRALLAKHGIENALDLDWWQSSTLPNGLQITFVPAQHFSGRGLFDRNATLWGGFVVTTSKGKIYFAGDTGLGPHFKQIKERFGAMDIALLPVGAFMPRWFMGHVHMSPSEALDAALILESKHNIGIHFGTFQLADDAEDEPRAALIEALSKRTPIDFEMLDFGEGRRYQIARNN